MYKIPRLIGYAKLLAVLCYTAWVILIFMAYKVAVLASTNGTDFQAMIDARNAGQWPGVVLVCLFTNKADCGAAAKARAVGIPVEFADPAGKTREEYDREVMALLAPYAPDMLALAGYMRIIGPAMIAKYAGRILNVHPSLLPKFAGGMNLNVHQAVLDAGEAETGMTIHVVTDIPDEGPMVCQKSVPVEPGDTAETLKTKVQALEKEWYPKVILSFAKNHPGGTD